MSRLPSSTEVLIVGAGPSGLALAAELHRRGVAPLVVDSVSEGENTSRAAAIHARTLEVLEPLAVTRILLAQGIRVPIFRVRDRDKILLTVDFKEIESAYNFMLMCPQNRTEAILGERLRALGGKVVRPAQARAIRFADERIDVDIEMDGAAQSVSTRWLVGCDGMHSTVRESAGIGFGGSSYGQSFVLADVRMDWPLARDEVGLFFSPEGLVVVAPLPGDHYRIVATVDDAPAQPTVQDVQALLDARGPQEHRAKVEACAWSSRFHVHHRVAESPRKGRVLLCGDAAHVHSPAGGQGMNTGIQDAVALGEALAEVLGGADAGRLDAWAKRRHEIAQGVVSLTDRMTRVATLKSPLGRTLRNIAVGFAGHIPPLMNALARNFAELDNK